MIQLIPRLASLLFNAKLIISPFSENPSRRGFFFLYIQPLCRLPSPGNYRSKMKFNIENPTTGGQKKLEIDDDQKLRAFYVKRISQEVSGDALGEQWSLPKEEESTQIEAAVENVNDENPVAATPDSVLIEKPNEVPSAEDNTASAEENSKTLELEESEAEEATEEEKSDLKLETAPADFRFPTTNQTRHCFTRYIEYHRCIAAKGDDAPECTKFAKYYRALCPGEWVDRWNEQIENGTFPGPL